MALFMVTMSGRFSPAMTMITNAVEGRYRGGFMSVNAALQQAASAGASFLSGLFITRTPAGQLEGFPLLGYVSIGFFALTVLLAAELRSAAPHVSAPASKNPVTPAPTEAVV
jgi:DHA1 family inner membrane transport protein